MGRKPCCDKIGLKRGPWTMEEDHKLVSFILNNGIHCWRVVPKLAGLLRCGKSCRLRWINYLRPDLKRGGFTETEEYQIIELHSRLGNRWSKIASYFPGRTDNEIKNHWNTKIKKKMKLLGLDPVTHKPIEQTDNKTDHGNDKNESKQDSTSMLGEKQEASNGTTRKDFETDEDDHGKQEIIIAPDKTDDHDVDCLLDLEPWLMTQETKQFDSTLSNSSMFSTGESNNSNISMNESSSLQENMNILNQWIYPVDPLMLPWDFYSILEDDLFSLGI